MNRIVRWFNPSLQAAQVAIGEIMSWADPVLDNAEESSYLKLMLCELAANAVEHGGSGQARQEIVLRVGIVPETGAVIAVGDKAGRSIVPPEIDEIQLSERGRGLAIVAALSEGLDFRASTSLIVARRRFGY